MAYLYALVGFALLIILHEAGHFTAAKAVGMRVERFSLFFGPMFVKRQLGETEYGIGVIPLGGYVKISGMTPAETFETPEQEARAYINQPVWKRIVVIAAGPVVNLVLAFILAFVFLSGTSHIVTTPSGNEIPLATIGYVEAHEPASGVLHVGDTLVSVDGVSRSVARMRKQIESHGCTGGAKVNGCVASTPAKVVVRRDGRLRTFEIRPRYSRADRVPLLGFAFNVKVAPNDFAFAFTHSASGLWRATEATVSALAQIFRASDRRQLSGPIGVVGYTVSGFSSGLLGGTQVLALISLSLGLINLFPFLPLDGGHIFWALAEKLRGRRIPMIAMERASMVGIALIVLLFVVVTSNDISKLAAGGGFAIR